MSRQGALFADESRLPGGFRHVEEFLACEEEAALIDRIGTLELREAQYKKYTAKRRVASFGAGYDFDANELTFEAVAGVSLAGACTMRFRPYPPRPGARILTLELAPRSAYLLVGDVRWQWRHCIAPTPELRFSITFRTRAR